MNIGDIFYFDVAYEEDPTKSSNRPVIILDELDGDVLLLISTTTKERSSPSEPHDDYKIPILNWRKVGLPEASWCRGKILIRKTKEEIESLIKPDSYIGNMPPQELNLIITELERLHNR